MAANAYNYNILGNVTNFTWFFTVKSAIIYRAEKHCSPPEKSHVPLFYGKETIHGEI